MLDVREVRDAVWSVHKILPGLLQALWPPPSPGSSTVAISACFGLIRPLCSAFVAEGSRPETKDRPGEDGEENRSGEGEVPAVL